uniref:RxLR effector protein n=1 Tax=Phytophthora agathidicida TaxID=1642459 RepID=A0A7G4WI43_9STRA|nr:PaRXLR54 [Phytophthora agathidicida]
MRLHYIVLLGASAVFASANAISMATKDAKSFTVHVSPHSVASSRNIVSTNRFLRTHELAEVEEERVNIMGISAVDKFSNFADAKLATLWMKKGVDADDVFIKLKLPQTGDKILESPKFFVWAKYVNDYNAKFPDKQASTIPLLTHNLGGEAKLAKALLEATKVESTRSFATALQTEQLTSWVQKKYSADKVFKALNLNKGLEGLPSNPLLSVWTRYVDKFNPSEKTTLFATLRNHYSEKTLSQFIISTEKAPRTKEWAADLQNQRFDTWLFKLESPQDVFKFLMLDEGKVFGNPQLTTWLKYAAEFKAENPYARGAAFIDVLRDNYSDAVLVGMITAAKEKSGTKILSSYAERELIGRWATERRAPAYVSKVLEATDVDYKNYLFGEYVKKFRPTSSD